MRFLTFRRLTLGLGRVTGYPHLRAGVALSWDYYQRAVVAHVAGFGVELHLVRRRSRLDVARGEWVADWWRKP